MSTILIKKFPLRATFTLRHLSFLARPKACVSSVVRLVLMVWRRDSAAVIPLWF